MSSLARAGGTRPQSMSAIVMPLQESGLISGSPEGRAARQDWLTTTISQKLSVDEQETLQAALELLNRWVED